MFSIMLGSVISIMLGGYIFISQYKHLLIMLVSLEMMALGIIWLLSMWFAFGNGEQYFILVYMSFAACEGSLGLGLLVCLVRSHGSDKFEGMSILMC